MVELSRLRPRRRLHAPCAAATVAIRTGQDVMAVQRLEALAVPFAPRRRPAWRTGPWLGVRLARGHDRPGGTRSRSEEHTSELQSRQYLVCRLLLEKKKKITHSSSS